VGNVNANLLEWGESLRSDQLDDQKSTEEHAYLSLHAGMAACAPTRDDLSGGPGDPARVTRSSKEVSRPISALALLNLHVAAARIWQRQGCVPGRPPCDRPYVIVRRRQRRRRQIDLARILAPDRPLAGRPK